ncbi:DNA-binding MarR family transcriptional regulator [Parabacteroides sp. PFB2-12]|uniref:MarR family winged helix-turn-helix transcriptional regulator n=1 Tax=unclassified Parabacteroides TaxID=2649774 RepID=UPI0024765587|nr:MULTISPECIES: MarR family transcriptional regulator [unclassified Parabacteroides]MDH6342482.1 DNA-binding MarR family transcriptional regulator [Parabacteroides sp. PM6-13]MDH6390134.1 DNA-binding MarR family transcriptional regulator [Parabacteroides sp. PFB2-12]
MSEKNIDAREEPLCRIRDIYRAISDFEVEFADRYGVKLNEGMLLCSLKTMGQCSSGRIAELLGLSLSNASKVILSAEKKGLVERIVGKEDKRQMLFLLTEEGKKCIESIKCESNAMLELISKIKEI